MSNYRFTRLFKKVAIAPFLLLIFMVYSGVSYSQAVADFSGTWIQDNTKSDDFYKSFDVKFVITQTQQKISIKQIFYEKDGKEAASREAGFNLDGKEVSKEEGGTVSKESAKWSADKKILTTRSTKTAGPDTYGSTATYSMSPDGKVLTVQTSDINQFGPSVKQVFNKQK
jgi:hypothetical protein